MLHKCLERSFTCCHQTLTSRLVQYFLSLVCVGSSGRVRFSDLEPGTYWLRVAATNYNGDRAIDRRRILISSDPSFCTAHLINGGVTVEGGGTATVEFTGDGPVERFSCSLDRGEAFTCECQGTISEAPR